MLRLTFLVQVVFLDESGRCNALLICHQFVFAGGRVSPRPRSGLCVLTFKKNSTREAITDVFIESELVFL